MMSPIGLDVWFRWASAGGSVPTGDVVFEASRVVCSSLDMTGTESSVLSPWASVFRLHSPANGVALGSYDGDDVSAWFE